MGVVGEDEVGTVEDMYGEVFDGVMEVVERDAESVDKLAGTQCTKASFEVIEEAGLVRIEVETGRGVETRWVDIRGAVLVEERAVELCGGKDCLPAVTVERLYVEGRCYYDYGVDEDAVGLWVTGMLEEHFPDLMVEYYWRSRVPGTREERRHKKLTEYLKRG
jgi:hypothetical protein